MNNVILWVWRFLIVGMPLLTLSLQAAEIESIEIESEGYDINPASVRAYVGSREGDELSRKQIALDVKALERTERYSEINVEVNQGEQGLLVRFVVTPKPRLRALYINGDEYMTERKIKSIVSFSRGDLLDGADLEIQIRKLKAEYNKKFFPNATATFGLERVEDTGYVDVYLNIQEGARAKVKKIDFDTAREISSKKIRKVMAQKKAGFFSFITGSGVYDEDLVETDLLTIRDLYRDAGFLEVKVGEPDVYSYKSGKLALRIPIEEGEEHRIRNVIIRGAKTLPEHEVKTRVRLTPGHVARIRNIEKNRQLIRDFYGSRGHFTTRVRYQLIAIPGTSEIDLMYQINEGDMAYIRNVEVRGNTRTKDKVIRRELTVYPGDVLNEVKMRTGAARLRNTQLFGFVNHFVEPTDKSDTYDVVYEVEEKQTGQFSVGAGFSSIENVVGFAELSQGNFDLFGWPNLVGDGQKIRLKLQLGSDSSDYELSFVEPYFLDYKLSLGVDAFQREREFFSDDYDQRDTGGSISLGRPITSYLRTKLTYTLQEISVQNVSDSASELIKLEGGDNVRSSLGLSFTYDSRDNFYVATRGMRNVLSAKIAGGPLGFDVDLYTLEFQSSTFIPLLFGHVFNLRGSARSVEEFGDSTRVPIFDRFFLGGARTIRGFKFREVGPRDSNGEPIGGKSSLYGTAEYLIPVLEQFRLAAFYDVGVVNQDAFDFETKNYNSSYGIGVRLDMPGFPLQLDYSWPLETDQQNDRSSGRFSFLIGYLF